MGLLIVGSIALDSVETPNGRVDDAVGGSAVYGAYAAALFNPPAIVGVVGEDFPRREVAQLARRGVDTAGIQRIGGGRTFRWGGRYLADLNQRETLFTELNVFADFKPDLPPAYRGLCDLFLANIDPDLQLDVLNQVRRPRVVVCDTMNLWIDIKRPSLRRLLKKIDVLLINDEEARMLADTTSLVTAAQRVRAMGVERLIIKKGEHGAMMFGPEGPFALPALPLRQVKDPTGAGDSFAGGMMGWISRRALTPANWRRALVVGTAMASFCVEDFSVNALRNIRIERLNSRIDALCGMMTVGRVRGIA